MRAVAEGSHIKERKDTWHGEDFAVIRVDKEGNVRLAPKDIEKIVSQVIKRLERKE